MSPGGVGGLMNEVRVGEEQSSQERHHRQMDVIRGAKEWSE